MSGWFPAGREDNEGWRLDVVTLLAVLGESSVTRHIQALNASKLSLLPRLIPAPHAFVKTARVARLQSPPAIVCGVYSGTLLNELNYFADIIHPISQLKPFEVKVIEVSRTTTQSLLPVKPRKTDLLRRQTPYALMSPARWSPLNILTLCSFFLTIGVLVWALILKDGTAALGIATMSISSTLLGIAFYWRPRLAKRPSNAKVPKGNTVIRTREGAFMIVQCSEEIARELYTGAEECDYLVSELVFRALVGVSMVLIMISVVMFGNCEWTMQATIGAVYIALNGLYWAVALLPDRWFWDLSRYTWKDVTPRHLQGANDVKGAGDQKELPSFTKSLWCAVQATQEIDWVMLSGAAPKTRAWEEWLQSAFAHRFDPHWDAVREKDRLMEMASADHAKDAAAARVFEDNHEIAPVVQPDRRETV